MYESFFGLREKPFGVAPDPAYFFLSERHGFACTMLEYAISNRADFAVVTGDIGAGKTILIRQLLRTLPDEYEVGMLTNTHPHMTEIMPWILSAFEQEARGESAVALQRQFERFVLSSYQAGRTVLLIIDEAQNLQPSALESVRLLSNINVDKHRVLQVILVGQHQLRSMLQEPALEQLAQRVAVDFNLTPLKAEEVRAYIGHRLEVAGRTDPLFSDEACAEIARLTRCLPRRINILCDTALVFAYGKQSSQIDAQLIREVQETLGQAVTG
ncbi:MAG: AAA family ATPase [Halieaceae bacterium]|nr:AAA family ATPase [Halieaceae bacterium]